jgi:hypothetical protein
VSSAEGRERLDRFRAALTRADKFAGLCAEAVLAGDWDHARAYARRWHEANEEMHAITAEVHAAARARQKG